MDFAHQALQKTQDDFSRALSYAETPVFPTSCGGGLYDEELEVGDGCVQEGTGREERAAHHTGGQDGVALASGRRFGGTATQAEESAAFIECGPGPSARDQFGGTGMGGCASKALVPGWPPAREAPPTGGSGSAASDATESGRGSSGSTGTVAAQGAHRAGAGGHKRPAVLFEAPPVGSDRADTRRMRTNNPGLGSYGSPALGTGGAGMGEDADGQPGSGLDGVMDAGQE